MSPEKNNSPTTKFFLKEDLTSPIIKNEDVNNSNKSSSIEDIELLNEIKSFDKKIYKKKKNIKNFSIIFPKNNFTFSKIDNINTKYHTPRGFIPSLKFQPKIKLTKTSLSIQNKIQEILKNLNKTAHTQNTNTFTTLTANKEKINSLKHSKLILNKNPPAYNDFHSKIQNLKKSLSIEPIEKSKTERHSPMKNNNNMDKNEISTVFQTEEILNNNKNNLDSFEKELEKFNNNEPVINFFN